jgi:hypothetical protein
MVALFYGQELGMWTFETRRTVAEMFGQDCVIAFVLVCVLFHTEVKILSSNMMKSTVSCGVTGCFLL